MTQVPLPNHMAEKLQQLADEQGATLLELIEQIVEDYLSRVAYDEASDPAIGLLYGPTDLAGSAKQILLGQIKFQSGWTQKENFNHRST